MKYETIEEIYEGNKKIRTRLKELVATLTETQMSTLPEGEKWTVAQIIEHISMVDDSAMRICSKLLKKAEDAGRTSDGKAFISDEFLQKSSEIVTAKLNAPDIVQPNSGRAVNESLAKMDENTEQFEQLRKVFESVDGTELRFPHPFFGDMSAHEWLALKGGHEMRHIKQIEKVLAKIN